MDQICFSLCPLTFNGNGEWNYPGRLLSPDSGRKQLAYPLTAITCFDPYMTYAQETRRIKAYKFIPGHVDVYPCSLWFFPDPKRGILTDFSVHSFSESEPGSYLIGFFCLFAAIGILAFFKDLLELMQIGRLVLSLRVKHSYYLECLPLSWAVIFVFFRISAPLLTGFFRENPSNVSVDYDHFLNVPVVLLIDFFLAFSSMMNREQTGDYKN